MSELPFRLAYLLDRFPNASETFIAREIAGLADLGAAPDVYALRRGADTDVLPEGLLDSVRLKYFPRPFSVECFGAKVRWALASPRRVFGLVPVPLRSLFRDPRRLLGEAIPLQASFRIAQILRDDGIEHVHAHFGYIPSSVAWVVHRLVGIPYSVSVHAWDIFVNRSLLPEKLVEAERVVCCTAYARDFLLKRYSVLGPAKVVVVHHGVDAGRFVGGEKAASSRAKDSSVKVLAIGRLVPKKGFKYLLDAAGILKGRGVDFRLEFVGDGPERSMLEGRTRSLDIEEKVSFAGWKAARDVAASLLDADILVVPSIITESGDSDGLPNVVLEAMAARCAVVASRIAGIPEAVDHERTGLLVRPGEPGALADAVELLALDKEFRAVLTENGLAEVRSRFSVEGSCRKMLEVFRSLAGLRSDG